jgi:putative aminopeptidase FrvX
MLTQHRNQPFTDHPALTLFTELLAVSSPSSREEGIATIIRVKLDGWGYAHRTDSAGNVFVRLAGRKPDGPLCCFASHMDEIGMVVTRVEADGSLRVDRSGGLYPWKHGEGPIEILGDQGSITGVLSMGSTHTTTTNQAIEWSNVRVLTGLSPAQLTEVGVRPGSLAVPARAVCGPIIFGDPADPLVGAWTFDDRMGVVALLRLLETLKRENLQPNFPTIIAITVS